jgi:heat shock protein HslJ
MAAAAVLAGLAGCSSMTASTGPASPDGTAWVLSSLPGHALAVGHPATAHFAGGRMQGTDGCNRYSASYAATGSAIEIGSSVGTRMACAPDVTLQADALMSALTRARSYRIGDGRLALLAPDGAVLADFAAQSQSLAGSSWRATGINNGKDGVTSVVSGSTVTMDFAADGKVSGTAGCNNYSATYRVAGSALRFTPAAATRKMCADPGVMEQEQAFFKALDSVATMRMEADRLELRTAVGALAVSLARGPGR